MKKKKRKKKNAFFLFDPGESGRSNARFSQYCPPQRLLQGSRVHSSLTRAVTGIARTGNSLAKLSDAPLMPLWQLRAITRALAQDAKTF